MKCFLVSSKTPRNSTLQKFKDHKTKYAGVFHSEGPICGLFPIISLNDLSNAPHNILFKLFASKKKATIDATKKVKSDLYRHLPKPLKDFLNDYINSCLIEGGENMDYLNLTQKERMELRQEWLSKYSVSERLSNLSPSEVLSNYSPSEVLSNYSPSEVLSNISTEKFVAGLSEDQLAMLSKLLISGNKAH